MELKKIGVMSFAKVTTVFGLVIGIIQTILVAILQKLTENLPAASNLLPSEPLTLSSALGIILFSVVVYFIVGVLAAVIYNLTAKYLGGVRLTLIEAKKR